MYEDRQNATVLIIDDDPGICDVINDALREDGLDSDLADSVNQAEALIDEKGYDVIVSDIDMPGKDGFELLHSVCANHPEIKTILMTGKRREDWAMQAAKEGAFDYIEKPFDLATLRNAVQRAMQLKRAPLHRDDPRKLIDRYCIVMLDHQGIIRYVGENFASIIARSPIASIGMPFDKIFKADGMTFDLLVNNCQVSHKVAVTLEKSSGQEFPAEISIEKAKISGENPSYIVHIFDVSPAISDSSSSLTLPFSQRSNAGHDPLTGLPNHSSFQEELSRVRASCRRYGRTLTVAVVNIEGLRSLNVTHGHATGDIALIELSRLCRSKVRVIDYIARYSGTQFAVIMPETDGGGAMTLAQRIKDVVQDEFCQTGTSKPKLSVSVGLAECFSGFIENQNELLAKAEEALLAARKHPENPIVLWDPRRHVSDFAEEDHDFTGRAAQTQIEKRLRAAHLSMVRMLVAAVEAKDPYTKDHSLNVAEYAEYFARCLDLPEEQISIIRCAATLHDVGKIGIPDAILTKPARLTDEEFRIIKMHTIIGSEILSQCSFLDGEAEMVRHHHERYDGSGYPDRIASEKLTLGARILQVADSFDTMICARFYKKGYPLERVLDELQNHSGLQFDPEIAQLAIDLIHDHPERIRYSQSTTDFIPAYSRLDSA